MLQCQRPPRRKREPIRYPEGVGGPEVCDVSTVAGRKEYQRRKVEMWKRQNYLCPICGFWICFSELSFENQEGRGYDGGLRDDRIEVEGEWHNAAVHCQCNLSKGSKRYQWLNGKYVPVVKIKEVA